ncbi:hypothetical protein ACOMHN_066959 [Nucella lapillus]
MEAKALYKFDASQADELPFQVGDILIVRNKDDKDWFQAEKNGRKGFIPNTYVQMEPHEWYKGNFSRRQAEEFLMRPPNTFDGSFIVRDCQTDKDQFSLSVLHGGKPQHFKILSSAGGGYYLWPEKTFTSVNKLIDYHRSVSVAKDTSSKILLRDSGQTHAQPTFNQPNKQHSRFQEEEEYEALYDFQSESPEELSFSKGCRIRVLDKSDPNWWCGEVIGSKTRESGLLPNNYIRKVSP